MAKTIYPTKIQTTTGHSIAHATQKITNPNNLCSDSKSLAYWGVKKATYVGIYIRNYYDSVTTISGSYHTPETIYATNWDVGNIPTNAIVNKITIEYKWEQISYSCGLSDCYGRFDKPTITLISNGKNLTSLKGAKPEAIRYNNNKTNVDKMNTNSAELATLHSHTVDISNHKLTIADLKKMKLKFAPAKNTYHNHCRIVMQFIRIKVDYKEVEILPSYRIEKAEITPNEVKLENGIAEYTYTCKIKSSVPHIKATNCTIVPTTDDVMIDSTSITCSPSGSNYDVSKNIWNVNKFSNYQATLTFKARSQKPGTKKIKATINKYADSIKKEAEANVNIVDPPNNLDWNVELENESKPYIFDSKNKQIRKCLKININRDQDQIDRAETLIIDTDGWITENVWYVNNDAGVSNISIEPISKGVWKISNLRGKKITIRTLKNGACIPINVGEYHISVKHTENRRVDETKNIDVYVTDASLPMDYFKLRLEDGSDVKYNSLTFSKGDDLTTPLTYTIDDDDFIDNLQVNGEIKHIPTHEARYITYTILSDVNIENALCKIDIYNLETGEDCSEVIISCDDQASIFTGNTNKFCLIDKIVAKEKKKIKFVVQSDIEQNCEFKLKVLNYDEFESKWKASYIYFKDMPSIKLSIESDQDDLTRPNNDIVNIYYSFENKSIIDGTNLKFQLKEPSSFNILEYELYEDEYPTVPINAFFNENSRIITFSNFNGKIYNELTEKYETHKYILHIKYQATQKGIYDFKLNTYDDEGIDDDQWINSANKKIMVDISSHTLIKTSVNNQRPYINELIDFKINIKNYLKKQDVFSFTIKDIGMYEYQDHRNDYQIEYYDTDGGEFVSSKIIPIDTNITLIRNDGTVVPNAEIDFYNDDYNKTSNIGFWTLNNIDVGDEYELILTLKPQELGYHIIETTFTDSDGQIQKFENTVNVIECNKQIDFNVYHAISTDKNIDCGNCDQLTEICDDDYIDLNDELYYVCKVTNNSKNPIEDITHIYIRLDDSFLENGILCSSYEMYIDADNNLLSINIPYIKPCDTVTICFKILPTKIGKYVSNFMLTNRNAHVYHKNLTINVDNEFNQKQIEHEITVYNFEKTNHYYRYELDGNNNIFKFFNQGRDKSLRLVDTENYNRHSIETYKGSNLQKIVRDITNNSNYVEPELLRIGNNHLATKAYELYPDGFMRRFGLLNSEIFHYTGQLPVISNLADKAMRWNEDPWNTKVWGGDIYDNGVFDLTIDYAKIPTNFNILEIDNPIKNLQTLVDKVKPYGTKALCYYSAKLYLDLAIDAELDSFEIGHTTDLPIKIDDIGLISLYNRHDNSIHAYYDLFDLNLKNDIDLKIDVEMSKEKDENGDFHTRPFNNGDDQLKLKPDMMVAVDVFDKQYDKQYISECFDIVQKIYSYHPSTKNINITKSFEYNGENNSEESFEANIKDIYSFEYEEEETVIILINEEKYYIKYIKDELNKFTGFTISDDNDIIFNTNFYTEIHNYNIQMQVCNINNETTNNKIIHIFCSINNQKYVHIGYIITNILNKIIIKPNNYKTYSYKQTEDYISFSIRDTVQTIKEKPNKIVQFNSTKKWNNLSNISLKNEYTYIDNDNDIDIECKEKKIQIPTLGFKFDNINISDNDEVIDVGFKVKARSNKPNFEKDININLYKDGDKFIPENNVAKEIYYPNEIVNINEEYTSSIIMQQPNITICSNCMKTALGLFDKCPYCESENISHYDEKKDVTICNNCGWIVDGWNDYCKHCLSDDVEKTKVDFNKTYCYSCGHLVNDYYTACPKCFHTKLEHLTNDETKYWIKDKKSTNIKPIIIKSDTNRVNICNIEIPSNAINNNASILESLNLHLFGHNNNNGDFYICPECKKAGLGHVTKCQYCNNTNVINSSTLNNITMDIYYQMGNYIKKLDKDTEYDKINNEFDISIDILQLAKETSQPTFKLLLYAENLSYDDINLLIENADIDEESYDLLVDNVPIMDISLDNIYYEHKYVGEKEWEGLDKLHGLNHTGITYVNGDNKDTDYIKFSDFGIDNDDYEHIYLHLDGINKADKHVKLDLNITDQDNNIINITKNMDTDDEDIIYTNIDNVIPPNLFNYKIDILELIQTQRVKNLSIQLRFINIQKNSEIIITHAYLVAEKHQAKNILHKDINKHTYNITNIDDVYFINTDYLFNLKKEIPYYIDGKQLETNLICYLDFGKLSNEEYIRLYDIEMIILYKNKYGKLITQNIEVPEEKYTKQMVNGNIQKNNTEIWGSNKTSLNILNNLESQIFNNTEENSLQSTPLMYELNQAFSIVTSGLSRIHLNYNGRVGYPNSIITIQVFDDYQNKPDNLLYSNEIVMPDTDDEIIINVDLDDLPIGQYWFKLIDHSADENNYHRFNHNKNVQVGNLIISNNSQSNQEITDYVLSFAIDTDVDLKQYYDLPVTLDLDKIIDFKSCQTFYRYNTKSTNNIYLKNLKMQTGYLYYDDANIEE